MSGISQADAFDMLARRLEHAREKHPVFGLNDSHAVRVIAEELQELRCAVIFEEGHARILDEALDVAATAMRLVMGEVEG